MPRAIVACYALHRQKVGDRPHMNVALLRDRADVLVARHHDLIEPSLTSRSDQKKSCRSCTHSKYETVTPPALARVSGSTSTPRSWRISSASGVVGPLAAAAMMGALIRPALAAVIWFSSAAG